MKVIIFTSRNKSGNAVFNNLRDNFQDLEIFVIRDIGTNKGNLLKRRVKKFGYVKVLNQLVFQIFVVKWLNILYRKRISDLKETINFNNIPSERITDVSSINDLEVLNCVREFNPDVIFVSGTGIIKNHILEGIKCPILNIHSGITPEYRGVYGMYWALASNEPELAGVTLHLVDKGIDTGKILDQTLCDFTSKDSVVTYPFLQLKLSLLLINNYLKKKEQYNIFSKGQKRKLLYHPTFTYYLYTFFTKGVK